MTLKNPPKPLPALDRLNEILRYEPETGKLYWLERPEARVCWNTRYAGKEAFTAVTSHGYQHGTIFGRTYSAHRVIWAMETGSWPKDMIDHVDGDRANNRIRNLREATSAENLRNKGAMPGSSSKYCGVHWATRDQIWQAKITISGKAKHLGNFTDEGAAAHAYDRAAIKYHGEFARLNFPRDGAWSITSPGISVMQACT